MRRSLAFLLALFLIAPAPARADKELKRKTKQMFKDMGEVGKHIFKKTKDKTVKIVHKIDQKLGGSGGDGTKR